MIGPSTTHSVNSGFSIEPAISQDGRYVAFSSDAAGLSSTDTNGEVNDVFRAPVS